MINVSHTSIFKLPLKFFLIVYGLSIPFWILGFIAPDTTKILPVKLPISALMTFCPLMAAAILIYKEQKTNGVKKLLKLSFDLNKITDRKWYIPIIFLMPVIAVLSYQYLKVTGKLLPETQLSPILVLIFFCMYFVGAIGEELGWSGYIINPLQNRYGALKASLLLGIVWAIWHIIPWSQAHQTTNWVIWQCIATIFLRVIMVWIFNNARKSVFAMILFHTMINISPYLVPNYGAHYNPFVFSILIIFTAFIAVALWGSKTMANFKHR